MGTYEFTHLMQRFYAVATNVLFEHEALLDKFVGDEVVGFFLPFMAGPEHARVAVEAARSLFRRRRLRVVRGSLAPARGGRAHRARLRRLHLPG